MISDYFSLAFTNLFNRKLRSWLTMIGIFIGIAAVVALIGLGQGMQDAINEQFQAIGGDKIFVSPKTAMFGPPGMGSPALITEHDSDVIEKVRGVEYAEGTLFNSVIVKFNDKIGIQFAVGTSRSSREIELTQEVNSLEIVSGRYLKVSDKRKVVIGSQIAKEGNLFGKEIKVGNSILINDEKYKVVGILKKVGDPGTDNSVFIPEDELRIFLDDTDGYNMIIVKLVDGADADSVAEDINRAMRKDRGLKEGAEDFEVQTAQQIIESFNTILDVVQTVLVGIAGISLLVGGIGIMNTMYTSVLERTKEIGIMKAVGAQNKDILLLMLFESGLLGLTGGVIGVLIGVSLSKGVEYLAFQYFGTSIVKAYVSWELVVGALLFSFLIGTLSGMLPARQASSLKPVDALRYE